MTKAGALVALASTVAFGLAVSLPNHAAAAGCSTWNLANDFRTTPNQANPNADSCGNPAVWYFDKSTAAVHDPANYVALDAYTDNFTGVSGLDGWYNSADTHAQTPLVLKNTNSTPVTLAGTATIPPNSMDVHPGSEASAANGFYAVVGWKSPVSGSVSISGGVSDEDPNGGDGVAWSIDSYNGTSNTTLSSGSYPNGGSQTFASGSGGPSSITDIAVTTGEFLYFVIDPKSDYLYDSTNLDVTITATPSSNVAEAPLGAIGLAGVGVMTAFLVYYRPRRQRRIS